VPVVTIVNGINNEQVGRIIKFALDNPKRIGFLSFSQFRLPVATRLSPMIAAKRSVTRCRIWRMM